MKYNIASLSTILCSAVILFTSGCTSIKTRQLFRSSDGKFSAYCLPWATKGIPCKFKVESGVSAEIKETIFIDYTSGQVVGTGNRIYDVSLTPTYSDQVFMVHIPRPLAGTLDLTGDNGKSGYHFNENGYLTSIGAEIHDMTIQDITSVLGQDSLGGFLKKTDANVAVDETQLVKQIRTIAVREFSYGNTNWYHELNEFVNQYQCCNSQCGPECQEESFEQVPQISSRLPHGS